MPEIHIEALVKQFGEQRALDQVGFTVEDGELFTLLGPSGCGKSTTLMAIAGFTQPDHGRIAIGDETFFDADRRLNVPAERRNLGIVFQSYAVWPHMTVFENLAFPLKVRKLKRREIGTRVREILELVEMSPYVDRYPHQLSGGQQQRVALGRALVYSPTVLLLDEPFSNLDAKLRERARAWVKELQQELGLTTIFVTHDQDEALSMSDRVVVMNFGEIQQIGTPEEVYRHPASRFVAEFVGRVNLIDGVVAGGSDGRVEVAVGDSYRLTVPGSGVSGDVTIAVRPEAVTFAAGESANTWDADVHTVAFLGDHYEYELTAGPVTLTVQSPRRVEGDRVTIHIPPDACSVVA
jgi:iron(III) transport system ATP-binding protein